MENLTGPGVFDTSAESWLSRAAEPEVRAWFLDYMGRHPVFVSAITVFERLHGYNKGIATCEENRRAHLTACRAAYVGDSARVLPVDVAVSSVAAELLLLVPQPPSPARKTHAAAESRADRLARWRFDTVIAATAIVYKLPLIHNNPIDFETLRMAVEVQPEKLGHLGPLQLLRCTRLLKNRQTSQLVA
jgi:predicted nucleic acid-binding protein